MGLSFEDAQKLGPDVAAQHPDAAGNQKPKPRVTGLNVLGQNKTEAAFDRYLAETLWARKLKSFQFEPFKLRLAGRTYYSPDFAVKLLDGSLVLFEVKGFMRDDAAVKLKTAAEQFEWLGRFYLVRKDKTATAGWDIRPVTRSGIGRIPFGDDWLRPTTAGGSA